MTLSQTIRAVPLDWMIAAAGAAAIAIGGLADGAGMARGLMVGWLFWISLAMGSAALLAVHALTGGDWGERTRPELTAAAGTAPVLALAGTALLATLHRIYPWAGGAVAGNPEFIQGYLNPSSFALREVAILAIWAAIAVLVSFVRRIPPPIAALALIAYAVTASFAATDWLMSLTPPWNSTAFTVLYGVSSAVGALALLAVAGRARRPESVTEDLAGLLIAGVLGCVYLAFMQFLVVWSGNLPQKVSWYAIRSHGLWPAVIAAAFVIGAAAPFLILLTARARRNARSVATAGALILCGLYLHMAWQSAPAWAPVPVWSLVLAPVAIGAAWLSLFRAGRAAQRANAEPREEAHG